MKNIFEKHKNIWTAEFFYSFLLGAGLLALSLVVNYFATAYATNRVSMPVTDLILSNVRVYDLDAIIVWGAFALIFLAVAVTLLHPEKIPFVLKCAGLFIIIRAIFISLTHLGPFYPQVEIDPVKFLNFFGIGTTADLFFSGHTGMPFLLALIYWKEKIYRWCFLAISVCFAVTVLLAHLHYSIDVFAAFFITYAIFELAKQLFSKDWHLAVK